MPSPIMLTEAAFLLMPAFPARRARPCRADRLFETLAELEAVDIAQLDAAMLRQARGTCDGCACRRACRRWLRTGVFENSGDPRCPNAALLHH